jgi:hypothetical protein
MLEALEKFDGEIADIFGPYQRDIENWNHNHLRPHLFLNSAVPRIERGSRKEEMVGGFSYSIFALASCCWPLQICEEEWGSLPQPLLLYP